MIKVSKTCDTNQFHLFLAFIDVVYIKSEKHEKRVVHVNMRQRIPYTASWDRSEYKSPGSSRTAWGTVSATAW